MINFLQTEVDFPVFKFCRENGIKCTWDFSKSDGAKWTEVLTDDEKPVFQFSDNMPVNIFIDLIKAFIKEYGTKEIENIGDDNTWWTVYNEINFNKFIEQHKNLFEK
jgi:hypothetical protein